MEIRDPTLFLDDLDRVHERTRRVVMLVPPADLEWAPAPGKFMNELRPLSMCRG